MKEFPHPLLLHDALMLTTTHTQNKYRSVVWLTSKEDEAFPMGWFADARKAFVLWSISSNEYAANKGMSHFSTFYWKVELTIAGK